MRGDDDFDAVFDRLLGRSYRHAVKLVGDRSLAEDLAAEALTRTYAHWSRVRSYEHLDAWVLRVVTNLAIDTLSKRQPPPLDSAGASAEDAVLLRVTLAQALRALPARQRDAVVLRYLVDMTEADAAEALGIARGTLKSHVHRAVTQLRRALGSTFDPRFEEG